MSSAVCNVCINGPGFNGERVGSLHLSRAGKLLANAFNKEDPLPRLRPLQRERAHKYMTIAKRRLRRVRLKKM